MHFFGFYRSTGSDWLGLVLTVLKVAIIENNPARQRDIDTEPGRDFQHMVTVLKNIWRE